MVKPTKKKVTIFLDPDDIERLSTLALHLNCVWGGKPNLSQVVRRLAVLAEQEMMKPLEPPSIKASILSAIETLKIAVEKL